MTTMTRFFIYFFCLALARPDAVNSLFARSANAEEKLELDEKYVNNNKIEKAVAAVHRDRALPRCASVGATI